MAKIIQGIDLQRCDDYAICHITDLSDDLKDLIRKHLSTICYGSHVSDYMNDPLYNYRSTIKSFIERYEKKDNKTQKGMIGEFLSHIIITSLFNEYVITSAFFNLEEKSIKKGFDLLLFNTADSTVWITEVKSGNLRTNKTHDQTTAALLSKAKNDLIKRLNEQETQYWHNAIHHVRTAVQDGADYRSILLSILRENHGNDAADGKAKSQDKNVVLISNLFAALSTKISDGPVKTVANDCSEKKVFANTVVFSIQKSTYQNVATFFQSEIEQGQK